MGIFKSNKNSSAVQVTVPRSEYEIHVENQRRAALAEIFPGLIMTDPVPMPAPVRSTKRSALKVQLPPAYSETANGNIRGYTPPSSADEKSRPFGDESESDDESLYPSFSPKTPKISVQPIKMNHRTTRDEEEPKTLARFLFSYGFREYSKPYLLHSVMISKSIPFSFLSLVEASHAALLVHRRNDHLSPSPPHSFHPSRRPSHRRRTHSRPTSH